MFQSLSDDKLLNASFVRSNFHVSDPIYHNILIRRKDKAINKIKVLAIYFITAGFLFWCHT